MLKKITRPGPKCLQNEQHRNVTSKLFGVPYIVLVDVVQFSLLEVPLDVALVALLDVPFDPHLLSKRVFLFFSRSAIVNYLLKKKNDSKP